MWKVVIKGIYRSAWFLQDSPCGLHVASPTSSLSNTNPWWVASSWSTNYHHLLLLWLEPSLLETEPLQPSEHSMRVPVLSGTLSTWLSLVCAGDGLPEPSGSTLQYTSKLHGEGRSGSLHLLCMLRAVLGWPMVNDTATWLVTSETQPAASAVPLALLIGEWVTALAVAFPSFREP